jgi:hypothetical protein
LIKHDIAVGQRKQGIVLPLPNILTTSEFITDLSDNDVSCENGFSTELLYTTPLGI